MASIKWIADRYKVIRKLNGNMSSVYHCRDLKDPEEPEVIIKLFPRSGENNGLQSNLFFREAENLGILRHKNIVRVISKGIDLQSDSYYLCVEYVNGYTLDELIDERQLTKEKAITIIRQILDGVLYSHSKDIIHRDLKPSNIMVDESLKVKLIDFGISKIKGITQGNLTVSNYMSPKYASPEQKLGRQVTIKSDIYSLGVVFCEILSNGKLPNNVCIEDIINSYADFTEEQRSVLKKMTCASNEDRYDSIADIKNDFLKYWPLETSRKKYYIQLTNAVVEKLLKLGYLIKHDEHLAKAFIEKELEGETYIFRDKNDVGEDIYVVVGKQCKLFCAVDFKSKKSFAIIGIQFPPAYAIQKDIEIKGMPVIVDWEVCRGVLSIPDESDIYLLISQLDEYIKINDIKRDTELKTKEFVENWRKILTLHRRLLTDKNTTIRYKHYEIEKNGESICVYIENGDVDSLPEDIMLNMTSKNNIHKVRNAGYIVEKKEGCIVLELAREADANDFAMSGEITIDNRMVEVALSRQEKALKAIQFNECKNESLPNILFNPKNALTLALLYDIDYTINDLDESKKDAVEKALLAKDLFLLQGPPGTGKTTFISELVSQILKFEPRARILISSQSNVAVNHALLKISEIMPETTMVRIGQIEKISLGAEKYLIDDQVEKWCASIRSKCQAFMQSLVSKMSMNKDFMDKYGLLLEIEDLQEKQASISISIIDLNKKLNDVLDKYTVLNNLLEDLKNFSRKTIEVSQKIGDEDLVTQVNRFREEYLAFGNKYLKQLDEARGVSDLKISLEADLNQKKDDMNKIENDITAGFEMLEIKNNDEFFELKRSLDIKMNEGKKEIERMAKLEKIRKDWFDRIGKDSEFIKAFMSTVSIIGATCLGVASIMSSVNFTFDWVIIDEAGRATPPELLVPVVMGKKIVLVGDHKQLPPIVDRALQEEVVKEMGMSKEDLEVSLFEYLAREIPEDCKGILTDQYRMHPAIGDLISHVFYEGKLKSCADPAKKNHGYEKWAGKGVIWLSTSKRIDKYEQTIGTTKQNSCEVEIIMSLLNEFNEYYSSLSQLKEVAVITGYEAQKSLLRKTLESHGTESWKSIKIEVNTVDAFQGRETDITLYSIVRSNKKGQIGFLSDVRRLNVALSRARELLVLIGDHESVTSVNYIGRKNPFIDVSTFIRKNPENCLIVEV